MTHRFRSWLGLLAVALCPLVRADVVLFDTDPFAGSTALTTPGRQVVGGEPSISFSIAGDQFAFDPAFFNFGSSLNFASGLIGDLPSSGANVLVLLSFDNDNDAATPFGAGTAANLIADRVTSSGAGFFVYFNSALDLARLVYSTDLSDNTADLKIMARMTNLSGQGGRDAMATFTAGNFAVVNAVPEASSLALAVLPLGLLFALRRRR